MTLTSDFLQKLFDKAERISNDEYSAAKKGVLDFTASSIAAKSLPQITALIDYYGPVKNGVPIIGYDKSLPPKESVIVNGYIAHYLDLDDVHSEVRGHPSAVILPALLALKDTEITAEHFYKSYIIGVDAIAALGRNIGTRHYEKGFHASSTLGSIASAISVSYALHGDIEKTENAVGIAVSASSGVRSQFGSEMKPFQLGMSAANGFEAALLSHQSLVDSNPNQLAAFFEIYGDFSGQSIDPGRSFSITSPGLWFKLYPCCSANYHAIDAVKEIIEIYDLKESDVTGVELIYPPNGDAALIHTAPKTGKEGMFSPEYVCSLLLQQKTLIPSRFDDREIEDETLLLMKKFKRTYDASITPASDAVPGGRFTIVNVTTTDGKLLSSRVDKPKGSPEYPLDNQDLMDKLNIYIDRSINTKELIDRLNQADTLQKIKKTIGEIK
ncbi:MmgE/PrpD family protein [Corticicoccus populi]|uniref:MmgE/PrpD family protein n=1 Tax=Corticicoccus populi TaxID=1812821 RepID=A0ABW5X000_9STAP